MKIDPIDNSKFKQTVLSIFDKMKTHSEMYEIQFGDRNITIFPNVFSPKYFTDSLWFAEELPKIVQGKSLLEIGTGTGIIALYAALEGSRVVAVDINPDAVKNAEYNFKKYNLDVLVKLGSVYEPLVADDKFDFIFWNHPFNNWDTPVEETLLLAGLDYQYNGLRAYVSGARKHLSDGGRLLLGTGNSADLKSIEEIAAENNFSLKILAEEVMNLENGGDVVNSYIIYEFIQ